jgi:hypothetical protein
MLRLQHLGFPKKIQKYCWAPSFDASGLVLSLLTSINARRLLLLTIFQALPSPQEVLTSPRPRNVVNLATKIVAGDSTVFDYKETTRLGIKQKGWERAHKRAMIAPAIHLVGQKSIT